MKAAIIIRMHYGTDAAFRQRFDWFWSMVAPRLWEAIAAAPFRVDLRIWADRHTEHGQFLDRILGRRTAFTVDAPDGYIKPGYKAKVRKGYHVDFVPWKWVRGLDRYDLQIAIDSDDLILRPCDVIERLHMLLYPAIQARHTAHVSFQPQAYCAATGMLHRSRPRYGPNKGFAFYALYQPPSVSDARFRFLYDDSHLVIGKSMRKRFFEPDDSYVAMSIHDHNVSTGQRMLGEPIGLLPDRPLQRSIIDTVVDRALHEIKYGTIGL